MIPNARFLVTAAMVDIGYTELVSPRTLIMPGSMSWKTYNSRISHGPLRSSPDTFIQLSFVRIISPIRISQEKRIDPTAFEQFGQLNPVFQVAFRGGFICGILSFSLISSVVVNSMSDGTDLTFHCPGDKCPTVDMSKALSRICFLAVDVEPFPAS